ncbi:citrulline utilization hydrolase CtlX [Noviherbaspirillum saxi]|uniref:Amidinotransferase n=1 Tax=Noviherbaspirillum saxi TaxID=2320863 RepID=A0A3A3FQ68_9BURK|nr:arginine deiminase-related protein [Noviherbaspirillum saxi]RJF95602.1 amidinotransferase [Noviherbaspirillum saxi]
MQTTNHVLMIRPVKFVSNPQTATSNAFQKSDLVDDVAQSLAQREFDDYVHALRNAGVKVVVVDDTPRPHTPDSIFPNNWVSFHSDGRVFLYPMEAPNRRMERRVAVLAEIEKQFAIREIVDLGRFEMEDKYLEGTGSMVLDHDHKIAYVCHSSRSHPDAMRAFEERTGFQALWFSATDRHGKAIYHTNVMMCVGKSLAIVCMDSIPDSEERQAVRDKLHETGKQIIEITHSQMESFAGNMLELRSDQGRPVFAMSRSAWHSLDLEQQHRIASYAERVFAPVETIERLGGGSARCMIAEIFLPRLGMAANNCATTSFPEAAHR